MAQIKVLKKGYLRISKRGLNSQALTTETTQRAFKRVAKISDIKRVVLVNKPSPRFYYFLVMEDF